MDERAKRTLLTIPIPILILLPQPGASAMDQIYQLILKFFVGDCHRAKSLRKVPLLKKHVEVRILKQKVCFLAYVQMTKKIVFR